MIHVVNPSDCNLSKEEFWRAFSKVIIESVGMNENPFHPLVFIGGKPKFGSNVYIGLFSEVNAQHAEVEIGDHCDIASFVSINVADSHLYSLELATDINRKSIILERHVFVGSHSFISGGNHIGHHSVVGAGTILINRGYIPPFSLIVGNPAVIKERYFEDKYNECHSAQQTDVDH